MTYTRKKSKSHKPARDHHQEITNKVVAALEAGVRPWQKPWDLAKCDGPAMPINGATGHKYRGINVLMLGMSQLAFASRDPRWQTYKQASEKGWQVRRGEHGSTVFFFKPIEVGESDEAGDDSDGIRRIPILKSFTVFHASQIDGIPPYVAPDVTAAPWRRPDAVDLILKNIGIEVRIGGERAFYCPSTDHIQMPPDGAFHSPELWSATLFHELGHATGAKHRLNRDLSGRYGSHAYSHEELRVELASVFLGSELGLPADVPNHASYLASWIEIL